MASFSVDITDVIFAGGRTGYKIVTISNGPSAGVQTRLLGNNSTYFQLAAVTANVAYRISTKQANDSRNNRTAYVRIQNIDDNTDYVDVNLVQYGAYSLDGIHMYLSDLSTITNDTINVNNDVGSTDILLDVPAGGGAAGTVTSGSSWLSSVLQTPTDTGFLKFGASYIRNIDGPQRTGTIEYISSDNAAKTLTVIQAGGTPTQTLSVTPSSISEDSAGGTTSIAVTYSGSTYGCDYSAISSWVDVSLSQIMTGVLSGTVVVSPNVSTAQRSGSVLFTDASGSISLPITQTGSAITLTVDKPQISYPVSGGSETLAVSYAGTLITNISSMPSWLSSNYVDVDASHRTYTFSAASNSSSARSFNLDLEDDNMSLTVPITQSGNVPALSIYPEGDTVNSNAGQVEITFYDTNSSYANPLNIDDVTYSVSSNWISYNTKRRSPYGDYWQLIFDYTENTSSDVRDGTITFYAPGYAPKTVSIRQNGTGSNIVSLTPPANTVNYNSGSVSVDFYPTNATWNTSADWVQTSSSVTGTKRIEYSINPSNSTRVATFTVSAEGYEPATYTLTQTGVPGDLIRFNPSRVEFNYLGGSGDVENITISKNGYNSNIYVRYTGDNIPAKLFIYGNPDVTVISSGTNTIRPYIPTGMVNDTYTDLEGKFEFYTAETGGIKIGELPVVWKGAPKSLTVWPNVLAFVGSSTVAYRELYMYVSATGTVTTTVSNTTPFYIVLEEENNTYKKYRVRCRTNDPTSGYIIFSSDGNSYPVYFQVSGNGTYATSPNPVSFPLSGGSRYMMISTSASAYDSPYIDDYPSWFGWHRYYYASHTPNSGADWSTRFGLYYVKTDPSLTERTYNARYQYVSGSNNYGYFDISQMSNALYSSPNVMNFSSNGGSDIATITFSGVLNIDESSLPNWLSITELSSESGKNIYTINVLRNTGDERSYNIIIQDDNGMIALPIHQEVGAPAIVVTPTSNVVSDGSGVIGVTVYGPEGMSCNISGNWMRVSSHLGNTYTFAYDANTSGGSRTSTATFTAPGYLQATYTLTQAAGSSLKATPSRLRFHKNAATKKISFSNVPSGQVDYTITYTDGYDWLSVDGIGLLKDVSVIDNPGIRRRATIKFSDHNNSSNYVIVQVIQGGEGYDSIWVDKLFYPEERDVDGSYYYRIVDTNSSEEYFNGVSIKPVGWSANFGGIDVPRIVENYIGSELIENNTFGTLEEMKGYCSVDLYNMTSNGYPGEIEGTFKYWNDWSGYEEVYDYTVCINDPINGRGCDNMIIPFCLYYDDSSAFTVIQYMGNGNVVTNTLPTPEYPFVMTYGSFNYLDRLEFRQDGDVVFSYDMKHCGPGAFIYRNRFGGWDSFLIEGNIIKTDNYNKLNYTKKGEYNSRPSYHFDEKATDSVDINTTYEAHTGWLTDEQSERLAFHLLSSPIVYFQNFSGDLYDTDQFTLVPVRITSSSTEYKKFRNGKRLVNYTITFEKGYIEKVRN